MKNIHLETENLLDLSIDLSRVLISRVLYGDET